tara:strand:- start:3396 stop:4196 length:801 start_codon:yes stop_codon:yes gene_type:complete
MVNIDDLDTKSLKKVVVNHNKQYKKMLLPLTGGRKAILPLVKKEFNATKNADGSIEFKHKQGVSKYTLNLPGTASRDAEDTKFKASRARDLANRRAKVARKKAQSVARRYSQHAATVGPITWTKEGMRRGPTKKRRKDLIGKLNKVKNIKEKAKTAATRMRLMKQSKKVKKGGKVIRKYKFTGEKKTIKTKDGKKIKKKQPTAREAKAVKAKKTAYKAKQVRKKYVKKKAGASKIQKAVRKKIKARKSSASTDDGRRIGGSAPNPY